MKISKTAIITFLTVLLLIGILFFIVYGCMSFSIMNAGAEHFETTEAETETKKKETETKSDEKSSASSSSKTDKADQADKTDSKATKEDKTDVSTDLTKKERELFEDLKDNKLSTEQITDLVKGGVLTEKLVEKFLSNLKSTSTEEEVHTTDEHVEGFIVGGSMFAKY